MSLKLLLAIIVIFLAQIALAQDPKEQTWSEPGWAIGMAQRSALIPFEAGNNGYITSIVPLIFFESERFWFEGVEGGYRFYEKDHWKLGAVMRLRFFDFPEEYQNRIQGDEFHWGLQARYKPIGLSFVDLELISDWQWHFSANIRLGMVQNLGKFRIQPRAEIKFKSKAYNDYYYGLTLVDTKAGMEWSAGLIASLRVWSNLYFYGSAKVTSLEQDLRKMDHVRDRLVPEFFLGVGFSNDRSKPRKEALSITPYIRVAHGWASLSSLNEIIRFMNVPDPNNNQLSSIFYGYPLTDNLFTLPLDFYLTGGFIWHWGSAVQDNSQEVALGVKLYVTVPWPVRWRIGFAEGWSYANKVPYVESQEMRGKDYRESKLLNYLDPSLDVNIGDIFGGEPLKHWWVGYSMHHRSGIFGTAQQFGRISGGSNYNTVYLLYAF